MNKFNRQWCMIDSAKDATQILEYDYSGYESWLQAYPNYLTKFFYIIERLYYKNSLLRKKLHESKQRAKSLQLKYDYLAKTITYLSDTNSALLRQINDMPIETNGTHWFRRICRDYPMKVREIVCLYSFNCESCPLYKTSCTHKTFIQECLLAKYRKE